MGKDNATPGGDASMGGAATGLTATGANTMRTPMGGRANGAKKGEGAMSGEGATAREGATAGDGAIMSGEGALRGEEAAIGDGDTCGDGAMSGDGANKKKRGEGLRSASDHP